MGMVPRTPEACCHPVHGTGATRGASRRWIVGGAWGPASGPWRPHLRSPATPRCPWTAQALTRAVLAEQRDAGLGSVPCWLWSGRGALSCAPGGTCQGQGGRGVDQPVKDGIGPGGRPARRRPVRDRQWAGDEGSPAGMTLFAQRQEVPALGIPEWRQAPGVEHEASGLGQGRHARPRTAIALGQWKCPDSPGFSGKIPDR
jgi:hypothetical protein